MSQNKSDREITRYWHSNHVKWRQRMKKQNARDSTIKCLLKISIHSYEDWIIWYKKFQIQTNPMGNVANIHGTIILLFSNWNEINEDIKIHHVSHIFVSIIFFFIFFHKWSSQLRLNRNWNVRMLFSCQTDH